MLTSALHSFSEPFSLLVIRSNSRQALHNGEPMYVSDRGSGCTDTRSHGTRSAALHVIALICTLTSTYGSTLSPVLDIVRNSYWLQSCRLRAGDRLNEQSITVRHTACINGEWQEASSARRADAGQSSHWLKLLMRRQGDPMDQAYCMYL